MNNLTDRLDGAPTENEGVAICLTAAQHKKLHKILDAKLNKMGGDTGIAKLGKIALISQKELNAIGAPPSSKCKAIANKAAMEQIKYKGRDGKPIATSNARANMSKIPEDIADKMTLHG